MSEIKGKKRKIKENKDKDQKHCDITTRNLLRTKEKREIKEKIVSERNKGKKEEEKEK